MDLRKFKKAITLDKIKDFVTMKKIAFLLCDFDFFYLILFGFKNIKLYFINCK